MMMRLQAKPFFGSRPVCLIRRLAIALWRYLQTGEIPAGDTLKPVAT